MLFPAISFSQRLLVEQSLKILSICKLSISNNNYKSFHTITTNSKPFIIGVAGGSASGKTTVCEKIMRELRNRDNQDEKISRKIICLAQDSFYRKLNVDERKDAEAGIYNFDHPNAIDYPLLLDSVKSLLNGQPTQIPKYDFVTSSRKDDFDLVYPPNVLLIEGILVFHFKELRDLINLKVFVEMDDDIRVVRRVGRDVTTRGRDLSHVLRQYLGTVKPAHESFCLPTKKYADVIIPGRGENHVAINLLVQHIEKLFGDTSSYSQNDRNDRANKTAQTGA